MDSFDDAGLNVLSCRADIFRTNDSLGEINAVYTGEKTGVKTIDQDYQKQDKHRNPQFCRKNRGSCSF